MEQIKEREFKEVTKIINKKTIELKVKGIITVEFAMHKVQCRYNQRTGILYLYDKLTDKKFVVNMAMAYMIKANEDRNIIQINLDNDEDITINII